MLVRNGEVTNLGSRRVGDTLEDVRRDHILLVASLDVDVGAVRWREA